MTRMWHHIVVVSIVWTGVALDANASEANGLPDQAAADSGVPDPSAPIQLIAQFLSLRPEQVAQLTQLLQNRQQTLAPPLQGIGAREKRLGQLLEQGGLAPEVGQMAIEIHALQKQVIQVQKQFQTAVQTLLDPDQRQRLEAVRMTAAFQPILPAFQQLGLI